MHTAALLHTKLTDLFVPYGNFVQYFSPSSLFHIFILLVLNIYAMFHFLVAVSSIQDGLHICK